MAVPDLSRAPLCWLDKRPALLARWPAMSRPAEERSAVQGAVEAELGLLRAAWRTILKDPAKAAALGYFWLTALGFCRIFGNGCAFGINAVDLASPSDFLVAGLRDPLVVLAAGISGAGLYWMWGKSLEDVRWRRALGPVIVALLALTVLGAGGYRYAVVAGPWNQSILAPFPMSVTLDQLRDGQPVTMEGLRIVLGTSDCLIFHHEPNETIVLKKDTVKKMALRTSSVH